MTIKRFEELTGAELYEILRCRAEVFVVEQTCIYQDVDGFDAQALHLFFEEEGEIRAYIRVIEPGAKFAAASIGRVLTMPAFRRQGLASRLMTRGIELARELAPVIEIEAQAYLRAFYGSFGVRPVSDEFLLDGIPHIRMLLDCGPVAV